MNWKNRIADWTARRMIEEREGYQAAPGGTQVFRWTVPGPVRREFTVIARSDAFDFYHSDPEGHYISVYAVRADVVLKLTWFLLWDWWILATWCGWKLRLWRWCLRARSEKSDAEEASTDLG
ncbi:hypothetical protein LCGC14_0414610 [marine sediment metagenome]|uniref:Uncharacterized protein n=1 Tax=marine sediment metagenome TaxID=412755 RepID=A0A0F9VER4_9ZZZZ